MLNDQKEDTTSLFKIAYHFRKLLAGVIVVSFVLSIIATLITEKKYSSSGIVFAPSSYNRSDVIDNPQFGYDLDADHLLQLLESKNLRDKITRKFNLINYYHIDTTNLDWEQKLAKDYMNDVTYNRSRYMSIVISAKTNNPQLSSDIVNNIIDLVNDYRRDVFRENMTKELQYKKDTYLAQSEKVDKIRQKIYALKKPKSANDLIYNHLLMISKGVSQPEAYKFISTPEMEQLIQDYKYEYSRYEQLKDDYNKAQYFYDRPIAANYVIDRAKPEYEKVSPSFSSNCLMSVFGSLFLTFTFLFIRYKLPAIIDQAKN